MAGLNLSSATLRVIGDDLIPDEVSRLLGSRPTHAQTKGEEIRGKKTGTVRIAKSGSWRLDVADSVEGDLNGQIRSILEKLTGDLEVWRILARSYKIDLFCGLFMKYSNEGVELSPESLAALGTRGIKLDMDIYGPLDDDE